MATMFMESWQPILCGVGMFVCVLIFTFVIIACSHKNLWKTHKAKTVKTIENVVSIKRYVEHRREYGESSIVHNAKYISEYHYEVDGQKYTGYGHLAPLHSKKQTVVYYDPQNPSVSCTKFEHYRCSPLFFWWAIGVVVVCFAGIALLFLPVVLIFLFAIR